MVGQPASSQPAWSSKARLRKRDSPFRPISPRKSIHSGGWCEDEELEEEPENGGGYYYTTAVVFQNLCFYSLRGQFCLTFFGMGERNKCTKKLWLFWCGGWVVFFILSRLLLFHCKTLYLKEPLSYRLLCCQGQKRSNV